MQAAQQQLDLKDIHLPDAVSWWPPAIGYWITLAIILLLALAFFAIKSNRQQRKVKRLALQQYQRIIQNYHKDHNQKKLVASLSELLRRAAISTYPSVDCASLIGEQWLNWLDATSTKTSDNFTDGPGYLLTEFIYSNSTQSDDIDRLIKLSEQWLKKLPASGKTL